MVTHAATTGHWVQFKYPYTRWWAVDPSPKRNAREARMTRINQKHSRILVLGLRWRVFWWKEKEVLAFEIHVVRPALGKHSLGRMLKFTQNRRWEC